MCFALFVGQAFLFNAYFVTFGTVITTFPSVMVDSAGVGYYVGAFAISNFAVPCCSGRCSTRSGG